jgi:pimeloyl-ACP methyl ester carboxylesterase
MLDASMTLRDGRALAYTDCGVPDGPLVFYFHGAPTSRLDLVDLDSTFQSLGVRVVSPDRPGYGGSSALPRRSRNDWADDVAALADHLDSERFAVTGISSGGPYVVTCAALLAGRVAAAAVVAGVTDMAWPPAWDDFDADDVAIGRLHDEDAAIKWCEEHFGSDGSRYLEGDVELAPADLAFMADEALAARLVTSISEAFRQGVRGYAQDATVQAQPWSFDLEAITAPVRVLHGEADTLVPIAHGRHTAELIPGAELETLPDHGHLSMFTEFPAIVASLTTALTDPAP